MRSIALALCLVVPTAGFADELQPAPSTEQPAPASLTPQDPAQSQPAVENARWCGAHGGCSGARSKGKWIVLGGVAGTVLTAVAVGVAVSFATRNNGAPVSP